jgi:hypothetical protein
MIFDRGRQTNPAMPPTRQPVVPASQAPCRPSPGPLLVASGASTIVQAKTPNEPKHRRNPGDSPTWHGNDAPALPPTGRMIRHNKG